MQHILFLFLRFFFLDFRFRFCDILWVIKSKLVSLKFCEVSLHHRWQHVFRLVAMQAEMLYGFCLLLVENLFLKAGK